MTQKLSYKGSKRIRRTFYYIFDNRYPDEKAFCAGMERFKSTAIKEAKRQGDYCVVRSVNDKLDFEPVWRNKIEMQ